MPRLDLPTGLLLLKRIGAADPVSVSPELVTLRRRGYAVLVGVAWACAAWMLILGHLLDARGTWPAFMLASLANVLPTLMWRQGRTDLPARLAMAPLAAVHPALAICLFAGNPWQVDSHMYFFVALSALAILCDWRPILLAGVVTIIHHIALNLFVPAFLFNDGSTGWRVVIHAVAIAMQCAVLTYLSVGLRAMIDAQQAARIRSELLAEEAETRRREAEAAVRDAHEADARAAAERGRREAQEREADAVRRSEMAQFADAFHTTVDGVIHAIGAAASQLEGSAQTLNGFAQQTSQRTAETALTADETSHNVAALADAVRAITASIGAIGSAVVQQAQLSADASEVAQAGHDTLRDLSGRTADITDFAETIEAIAGRTNLLALNASIEAARTGEAGRGFAVVAGEVKQLARQAAGATGEIRTLAGSVSEGAIEAHTALAGIAGMVGEVATAAGAIRAEVARQQTSADAIDRTAIATAERVRSMAGDFERIADVAAMTKTLSAEVVGAASTLLASSTELRQAADHFIDRLQAA